LLINPKIADVRIQIGNVFFVAHGARGVVVRSPIDLKALRRIAMLILCFLRLSKRAFKHILFVKPQTYIERETNSLDFI